MSGLRLVPAAGRALEIPPDRTGSVVGRSIEADLVLEDGSVSRKHARLELRGTSWFVVDLGSANGTFIAGQRIGEGELKPGTEVRFGSVSLAVEEIEADSPDATVAIPGMTAVYDVDEINRPDPAPPTLTTPEPEPETEPPPAFSPPPPPPPPSAVPAGAAGAPVPQMQAPPAGPPKGRGPLFWVGAGCTGCLTVSLLLAAGIFGSIYWFTQAPREAVDAQLSRIGSGDLAGAYAELAESYRSQVSEEQFQEMVAGHPALAGFGESSFDGVSRNNNTARLSGTLISGTGGVEPVVIDLVNERGEWRISSIRFEVDE